MSRAGASRPAAALHAARRRADADLAALRHTLAVDGPDASLPPFDSYGQHPSDVASDVLEREVDRSLELDLITQLAEIDAAIARLDQGVYGTCESCGSPISAARLDALPWTRWCRSHAAAAERNDQRVLDPAVPRSRFDDTTESDDEDDRTEPSIEERAIHIEHEPSSAPGPS